MIVNAGSYDIIAAMPGGSLRALSKTKGYCPTRSNMKRKTFVRFFSIFLLSAACLGTGLVISALSDTPAEAEDTTAKAEDASAKVMSIKGTCMFMRIQGTWEAKLTPTDTPDVYDAQYVAAFRLGGNHMTYVGQVKSDFKTTISGNGKSTGGGGNGNFEFSGKYGDDGIAQCNYRETGGQRSGTLTAQKPDQGVEEKKEN